MEEIAGEPNPSFGEKEIEKRKNKLKKFLFGWIKDNYDKVFLAVLIISFLIQLWIFFKTMNQPLWWDEADYLAAAKRWGLGLHITDIWYYRRGFLFPLIGALFFRLNLGEIGVRFLEVLFSTGFIAVSYFLISKMFNKKLALYSSIALSFSWVLLFFTGRILTDIPAAFFALLALLFFWKGYVLKEGNKFLYLFALFFAFAILTRMQSFMFAPAFLIYLLIKERTKIFKNKQLWITLGIFLLVLVPQFVLYSIHYGNPFTDLASHYLGIGSESNPVVEGNQRVISMTIFNYFIDLPYILSTPFFLLLLIGVIYFFYDLILGIDKLFKEASLQKKFFVLLWILCLFLIMGFIGSNSYVEQRYVTAALPFLFLIAISPFAILEGVLSKNFHFSKKLIFVAITMVLLLFSYYNISLAFSMTDLKLDSYSDIRDAGSWIRENSNTSDIIITQSKPQIVYYAERTVIPCDITTCENKSVFEKLVNENKPRYFLLSAYESYPEWVYSYPSEHPELLKPVKSYLQNQQPTAIIYEFNYS
jgi:4-amino-4-deoxy-L-arabinose transferase-like glycosyltransferase